jgi:hypothetical protein
MKHLKRFNEGVKQEELQEFCESSLAYLMDEGFTIKIYSREMPGDRARSYIPKGQFNIFLQKDNARDFFKWDDIIDYYIPFLQLLSNRYDIGSFFGSASVNVYLKEVDPNIRVRYRHKEDYSFVNVNKEFSLDRAINDDLFRPQGHWKDNVYSTFTPDPDLIYVAVIIKERTNQVKLDI